MFYYAHEQTKCSDPTKHSPNLPLEHCLYSKTAADFQKQTEGYNHPERPSRVVVAHYAIIDNFKDEYISVDRNDRLLTFDEFNRVHSEDYWHFLEESTIRASEAFPDEANDSSEIPKDSGENANSADSSSANSPENLTSELNGISKEDIPITVTENTLKNKDNISSENIENYSVIFPFKHSIDTYFTIDSFDVAKASSGVLLELIDEIFSSSAKTNFGFANIRPPGHHATYSSGMGFCLVNNVAIAAAHAQNQHGARKILILDWDVHFGNGTSDIFENESSQISNSLYISIHRDTCRGFYPAGQGKIHQSRSSRRDNPTCPKNRIINLPVDSFISNGDFAYIFSKIVFPTILDFSPDLLLISAGFDACEGDWLAGCGVDPRIFHDLTMGVCLSAIQSNSSCKIISVLEGGYCLDAIEGAVTAMCRGYVDVYNNLNNLSETSNFVEKSEENIEKNTEDNTEKNIEKNTEDNIGNNTEKNTEEYIEKTTDLTPTNLSKFNNLSNDDPINDYHFLKRWSNITDGINDLEVNSETTSDLLQSRQLSLIDSVKDLSYFLNFWKKYLPPKKLKKNVKKNANIRHNMHYISKSTVSVVFIVSEEIRKFLNIPSSPPTLPRISPNIDDSMESMDTMYVDVVGNEIYGSF